MYTIYSLQLHELHEYNFSNHPWNLFAQLNNDPRFFFTVEGPNYAIKWPPTSISGVWRGNEKSRRVIANGYNGGPARPRENSQSARRIDFLRINNFLPRAQSWRAVTKYRPRKKVGRETLTRRARSVHPPTPILEARNLFSIRSSSKLAKMVFTANLADENNSSNIKEIIFVRRRWAGMIEIIY